MGNQASEQASYNKKHPHQAFSNSSIVVEKGQTLVSAYFSVFSEENVKVWEKAVSSQPARYCKYGYFPLKHSADGVVCGSHQMITAYYPIFQQLLSQEIKQRYRVNKPLQESRLWLVLHNLCEVATIYHQHNRKVGDIQPQNILINSHQRIAVITVDSYPEAKTNYFKSLREDSQTYLAPEELNDVNIGYNQQLTDIKTGESFSIGLTCMNIALLENSELIYAIPIKGAKIKDFNVGELQKKKKRLKQSKLYSPELKAILINMTNIFPSDRIFPSQLNAWMKSFETQILKSSSFTFQNMPKKIIQTLTNEKMEINKQMSLSISKIPVSSLKVFNNPVTYYSKAAPEQSNQQVIIYNIDYDQKMKKTKELNDTNPENWRYSGSRMESTGNQNNNTIIPQNERMYKNEGNGTIIEASLQESVSERGKFSFNYNSALNNNQILSSATSNSKQVVKKSNDFSEKNFNTIENNLKKKVQIAELKQQNKAKPLQLHHKKFVRKEMSHMIAQMNMGSEIKNMGLDSKIEDHKYSNISSQSDQISSYKMSFMPGKSK